MFVKMFYFMHRRNYIYMIYNTLISQTATFTIFGTTFAKTTLSSSGLMDPQNGNEILKT